MLHGRLGTSSELRDYFNSFLIPGFTKNFETLLQDKFHVDIITPQATSHHSHDKNNSNGFTGWFNRSQQSYQLGRDDTFEDIDGINQSIELIIQSINQQDQIKAYNHIIIGGISMGGAMGLYFLSKISNFQSINSRIIGLFTIGSFLIKNSLFPQNIQQNMNLITHNIPILMLHGLSDNIIDSKWGFETFNEIKSLNLFNIKYQTYHSIKHELSLQMLIDIIKFINIILISNNNTNNKNNNLLNNEILFPFIILNETNGMLFTKYEILFYFPANL